MKEGCIRFETYDPEASGGVDVLFLPGYGPLAGIRIMTAEGADARGV